LPALPRAEQELRRSSNNPYSAAMRHDPALTFAAGVGIVDIDDLVAAGI